MCSNPIKVLLKGALKKCPSVRTKNCLDPPKTFKLKHQKPFFHISTTTSVCHRDPRYGRFMRPYVRWVCERQTYFVTLKMRRSRRARNTLIPNDVPGLMVAHTTSKMLPTITCKRHTINTVSYCGEVSGCLTKCCRRKLGESSWGLGHKSLWISDRISWSQNIKITHFKRSDPRLIGWQANNK